MSKSDEYLDNFRSISDNIRKGVHDITFKNSHLVGKYLYKKLDKKVVEALMLELEANLRLENEVGKTK